MEKATRLLTVEELAKMPFGHGWIEYQQDEADPVDFSDLLQRIGWADGNFALAGCFSDIGMMTASYNCPNGQRVWIGDEPPTDDQRRAAPWGGVAVV